MNNERGRGKEEVKGGQGKGRRGKRGGKEKERKRRKKEEKEIFIMIHGSNRKDLRNLGGKKYISGHS